MIPETARRRALWLGGGLVLAVAALIAVAVIPRVRTDLFPGATPEKALPAFWGNVIANVLLGAALLTRDFVTRFGGPSGRGMLWTAGLVALALGLFLVDAAFAYGGHVSALGGVKSVLLACAGGDIVAGAATLAVALLEARAPAAR